MVLQGLSLRKDSPCILEMSFLIAHNFSMPSKNSLKKYVAGGCYHIYNRGVEKRPIFLSDVDYRFFLNLLKLTLSNPEDIENYDALRIRNKSDSVKLIGYCLMPNHFHLLIRQSDETGMTELMRSIMTAYSSYFNRKYKRVGSLFQGRYKAALVDKDEYLVHLSRYIHMNPIETDSKVSDYPYSSYKYYLADNYPKWLKPEPVIELFKDVKEYQKFVDDYAVDSLQIIEDITLD